MQWEGRKMINCLFVGMGGFIGSVCRYLLGLLPIETSQGFPVKTLITNVIGAFVIGIIAAAAAKNTALNPLNDLQPGNVRRIIHPQRFGS